MSVTTNACSWRRLALRLVGIIGLFCGALGGAAFAQPCEPEWSPEFYAGDFDDTVHCFLEFDEGTGPVLYAGGQFTQAGGVPGIAGIARWNGAAWEGIGGIDGEYLPSAVSCMAAYDDGTGPALYIGGRFSSIGGVPAVGIAKWDGKHWSAVGGGLGPDGSRTVRAVVVFDDGQGPALYAGGNFSEAGGVSAACLARWDGNAWAEVGGGISQFNASVDALTIYDDGSGPALFAGGSFSKVGDVSATGVVKWDGQSWHDVGGGVHNSASVQAMTVATFGGKSQLFVGGWFTEVDGKPFNYLARWDGSQWATLGAGAPARVYALVSADLGDGLRVYAGSNVINAGQSPIDNRILVWDGAELSSLPQGVNGNVRALAAHDDGTGVGLLVGGDFEAAGPTEAACLALWRNGSWSPLANGNSGTGLTNGYIEDLESADLDGDGVPSLFATGGFWADQERTLNYFAELRGGQWYAMGNGVNSSPAYAMETFDDGTGIALYATGSANIVGGVAAKYIAKWNGSEWSALGSGLSSNGFALAEWQSKLFVGGQFSSAGGVSVKCLATWDGKNWANPGGIEGGNILTLRVLDAGDGPALYVGGGFTSAGGVTASNIARLKGGWSELGGGTDGQVFDTARYEDFNGVGIYAVGRFTNAGGKSAAHIARWDGKSWWDVGGGLDDVARALCVFDDGSGPGLYVAGDFTHAGGVSAAHLARWDGHQWSAVGGSFDLSARALVVHDADGLGEGKPGLYAGGHFRRAGTVSSGRIARWGCLEQDCYADLDESGALDLFDFLGFVNLFNDEEMQADCTGDTVFDLFDFLCFVNAFNSGC